MKSLNEPTAESVAGRLQPCDETHVAAIRDIFNEVILGSTALFEYEPRSLATVTAWLASKQTAGLPVLGCFSNATLLGFASYGPFRPFAAYRLTVEHSVYVHADHRGRGVGRALLGGIIHEASVRGLHLMVAGIESTNRASIELHKRFGFTHAGTIHEAGRKFDRWLDLDFYEKRLPDPAEMKSGVRF